MSTRPIGIFDSGVGGLTVVKSLLERLPGESFVYFGDTAHVPYGDKSREDLFKYARDIIAFLLRHQVKTILVACGTHSSVTLPELEKTCPVPIIGVVKPGARAAVRTTRKGKVGVIATQATVNSGSYAHNIKAIDPDMEIYSAACARFVPLIEAGILSGPETCLAINEYLGPLLDQGIDTLVLGCTHYPFLSQAITQCAGEGINLVDPAWETVEELTQLLAERHLLNDQTGKQSREFYVSGNDESFYIVGRMLLGDVIKQVHRVDLY